MKVIVFLILFALLGLVVGYVIFAKVQDKYISPEHFFTKQEGVRGYLSAKILNLEERRRNIFISGAVGAIVGLFFGVITAKKKK